MVILKELFEPANIAMWFFGIVFVSIQLVLLGSRLYLQDLQERSQPEIDTSNSTNIDAQEIADLKQECQRLRQQLAGQSEQLITDHRAATFQQLQSLLTQYQSLQPMIAAKPDLPAKNLLAMFAPLENLMQDWGYETIGQAWTQVPYDPRWHQPDSADITVGELVYVRFVGYREGEERILVPAKVSRTLPKR